MKATRRCSKENKCCCSVPAVPPGPSIWDSFAPAPQSKEAKPPLKPKREKKPKVKLDPAHVAAARELRDRYLERFNSGMVLPAGKYDVARAIVGARPASREFKCATATQALECATATQASPLRAA